MLFAGIIASLAACSDALESTAPAAPLEDVVWKIQTVERAITMAVDSTQQLTPRTINLNNEQVSVDPAIIGYRSFDPSYVTVTPTGLVTGVKATQGTPIEVYVSMRRDNVFRIDTVLVTVTPTVQKIKSLSLMPADSTRAAFFSPVFLFPVVLDENDQMVSDVYVRMAIPSDRFAFLLGNMGVIGVVPDEIWVSVSATAYGRTFQDSVKVTILNQASATITMTTTNAGDIAAEGSAKTIIQPCGSVAWTNSSQDTLRITLGTPANAAACVDGDPAGDVGIISPGQTVTRKFRQVSTTAWTAIRTSRPAQIVLNGSIIAK